jgi:hypothetical protein
MSLTYDDLVVFKINKKKIMSISAVCWHEHDRRRKKKDRGALLASIPGVCVEQLLCLLMSTV